MRIAMLLKCENGMYGLDDDQLRRLTYFASRGYTEELGRLTNEKSKPSPAMIEFSELLAFLRNPYRED